MDLKLGEKKKEGPGKGAPGGETDEDSNAATSPAAAWAKVWTQEEQVRGKIGN